MQQTIKKHIFLTGFMGSGKSTIGKKLARRMSRQFFDADDEIEEKTGKEIKDIFAEEGETAFREYEQEAVARIAALPKPTVISLGGGALISEKNLLLVKQSGYLIYIKSSAEEIWKRIRHSTRRPLLRHENQSWSKEDYVRRIAELLLQREHGYQKADLIIDRDGKEADEVADLLYKKLKSIN